MVLYAMEPHMDIRDLCLFTDEQLAQHDIAELNLSCAAGLPGTDHLDLPACFQTLDHWTDMVRRGTNNAIRNRSSFPDYDELSGAEYRVLTMFSVLYRHTSLKLNLDCLDESAPYDGADSHIQLIHGVLQHGAGATCCTAPVIFAAIGRRLGYPIKLVKTRQHIFCRWVGADGERFNIEATSSGYYRTPDEHYHIWPKPIFQEALRRGVFLTELAPRQELALFLNLRGTCQLWNLRPDEAVESLCDACRMDPADYHIRNLWIIATMISHAEREARSLYMVSPVPSHWRIPAWCRKWGESIYERACHELDLMRSQQSRRTSDFAVNLASHR